MSKYVNQEIEPDKVWINISKGKNVRAVVLVNIFNKSVCGDVCRICRDVYKLEDEKISTVNEMIRLAKEGENIRFYIMEEVREDNNDVTR